MILSCVYSSTKHHKGQKQDVDTSWILPIWMKGMVSTKHMQMQPRISKPNYEKLVEIMIHQELNQMLCPVVHPVDLVTAVRTLAW